MGYQPMPPGPPPQKMPAKGPPPSTVRNAVLLMFISAGLSLIGLIAEFALKSQLRDQIANNNPNADSQKLDNLVNTAVTVAVVVGVVLLVLYVLLALQVRKGKNWARIVTWVFAGLGALSLVSTLVGAAPTTNRVLSGIGGIIDIVLIILLALAPSNEYFRKPAPQQWGPGYGYPPPPPPQR